MAALVGFAVLLTLCTCWTVAHAACPVELQDCECGYKSIEHGKRPVYVTNCTNRGFDNTMMLRKLPPETEVLIFVGNEVKDLPLNIFGLDTAYENLRMIDFSNNHIQSIKGRTFHNVANVTKLVLDDNDLYIVSKDHHPRMFSNFLHLQELHLRNAFTEKVKAGDYLNNLAEIFENSLLSHLRILNMENNEISGIYRGEFCSLPSLEELYLADNRLKDIPLNFSCLKYLQLLDVGSNYIQYLGDETLKSLDQARDVKINLTANPFRCDCMMVNTYKWMQTAMLTVVNPGHLYCYEGYAPNVGKTVMSVRPEDLKCVPLITELEYHTSASFIVLTVGFICLAIVLTGLLFKNRLMVSSTVRRLIQPIRNKFHYVSLERRDNTMDVV